MIELRQQHPDRGSPEPQRSLHPFDCSDVKEIEVTIFHTAYAIVGGGEYGDRTKVSTKEEADHSLSYRRLHVEGFVPAMPVNTWNCDSLLFETLNVEPRPRHYEPAPSTMQYKKRSPRR